MTDTHTITITESQRQLILLALAKLSLARPGWHYATQETALLMDTKLDDGRAQRFEAFRGHNQASESEGGGFLKSLEQHP
jgi:hypothetical protein